METISEIHTDLVINHDNRSERKNLAIGLLDRQAAKFERSRFAWMAMLITFQSCLGSITCASILQNHSSDVALATCAMLSMGSNALLIALAPPKWCLVGFYLSVFVNTVLFFLTIGVS
jgi:hypothetical protein